MYYLIHVLYKNDEKIKDIILCRVINSLKRFKEKASEEEFNERMDFIKIENSELDKIIKKMVNKSRNIEFYDKLLRDKIIEEMEKKKEREERFKKTVKEMRKEIDSFLEIKFIESKIVEASNYSLTGNGKRLRPIIAW